MAKERQYDKMSSKRFWNVHETAHYLGLAPRTVYNRVAPGAPNPFPIRSRRLGRKVLFDRNDVEAFAANL